MDIVLRTGYRTRIKREIINGLKDGKSYVGIFEYLKNKQLYICVHKRYLCTFSTHMCPCVYSLILFVVFSTLIQRLYYGKGD